jgi:AcrR family transcriptional regulator
MFDDATTETIAAVGGSRASITRTASHTGISPSLISYHFQSKRDLIQTVAETIDANPRAWMRHRSSST